MNTGFAKSANLGGVQGKSKKVIVFLGWSHFIHRMLPQAL